jgi:hypothetical protein
MARIRSIQTVDGVRRSEWVEGEFKYFIRVCDTRKDAEFKLASDSGMAEDVFHYSAERG